jgi:hypothetical protein
VPNQPWADKWNSAEREQWIEDYVAGMPVPLPLEEHDEGECEHCDALRVLMRDADDRKDQVNVRRIRAEAFQEVAQMLRDEASKAGHVSPTSAFWMAADLIERWAKD